jgi:hypothetical protein
VIWKTPDETQVMARAGEICAAARPGVTTGELDALAYEAT